MFGLEILDIGIGLIFIFLVLSLICTAANEFIASVTNARARTLKKGIERLFEDTGFGKGFAREFFDHSQIRSLVESRGGPSYIPARTFSTAVLDLVSGGSSARARWDDLAASVALRVTALKDESGATAGSARRLDQTIRVLVDRAGQDPKQLEAEIGAWFDAAMERVSGWYKKKTQWVVLFVACLVAGATNADTVRIVESLSRDSALRSALVAQAEAAAAAAIADTAASDTAAVGTIKADIAAIEALGIPLGWGEGDFPADGRGRLQKLAGLLLTALALSLGAPFWFDLLKKAINIRSVGLTPQEAEEKRRRAA